MPAMKFCGNGIAIYLTLYLPPHETTFKALCFKVQPLAPFLKTSYTPTHTHTHTHNQSYYSYKILNLMASLFPYFFIYFLFLLLSSPILSMGARCVPPSAPSTIVTPLATPDAEDYETVKPQLNRKRLVFGGNEVKSCLPKGFRRSSAPSRFVNYHTSGGCSPTTDHSINTIP